MKRRLFAIFLLSCSLLSLVFGLMAPEMASATSIKQSGGSASTQYIWYYDSSAENKSNLVGALTSCSGDCGMPDSGMQSLPASDIIVTNGAFGSVKMPLDGGLTQKHDHLAYTTNYYCYPDNGFNLSTSADSSEPYVSVSFAIAINDQGNAILTDNPLGTTSGASDTSGGINGNVGSIHFPQVYPAKGTKTTPAIPAQSFTLNGSGGNYDIRNGVNFDSLWTSNPTIGATAGNLVEPTDFSSAKATADGNATSILVPGNNGDTHVYPYFFGNPDYGGSYKAVQGMTIQRIVNNCFAAAFNPSPAIKLVNYNALSPSQQKTIDASVKAAGLSGVSTVAGTTDGGGAGGGGGGAGGSQPSCETSPFSLSWILCPVIEGFANFLTNTYQNILDPLLDFGSGQLLTGSPYQVWSSFRVYGDIVLVIALLVIVFGESIGGGIIDAYTAKKVLPRLLIAAVLINLSIYIIVFAVDVSNILGKGIYSLMVFPFNNSNVPHAMQLHMNFGAGFLTTLGLGGGALWVATAGGGFLHFLFVTVLGSAALILFATLVTLLLRTAIIFILAFVSPVAFALYCLPNTEQYFRKWWDLLFRALLIYPIVGVIFAGANIVSFTLSQTGGSFSQVLALFGLFAPLVMVPFAFRFAGGAIGAVHQGLQSRVVSPGMKGIAGVRARRRQTLHERRMGGEGRMGSGRVGSLYRGAATLGTREGWTPTAHGRSQFRATEVRMKNRAADEALKNDNGRASGDDLAMELSHTAGMNRDRFIQEYMARGNNGAGATEQQARDALTLTEGSFGARMGSDVLRIAAFKARAASVTGFAADDAGKEDMFNSAGAMVRDGLMTGSDAMASIKANKSRPDQSGIAWGQGMGMINQVAAGHQITQDDINGLMDSASEGLVPGSLVGARREAAVSLANHTMRRINTANAARFDPANTPQQQAEAEHEFQRQIAVAAGLRDQINAEAPHMADEFASRVFGTGIQNSAPDAQGNFDTLSVRRIEEDYRDRGTAGDQSVEAFMNRRKEWMARSTPPGGVMPGAPGGQPGGDEGH